MQERKKPRVFPTVSLPDVIKARMEELFDTRLPQEGQMSRDKIISYMREADVLVPSIYDQIDAEMMAHAGENLKLIANFGNGVEHIDVEAAAARGIMVTNTPNVQTQDTADMTMALILAVPRRLVEGAHILTKDAGKWPGWSPNWMLGRRIWGKNLGIIGMGRIGMAVAARARAFGLSIHYHNRHRAPEKIESELNATYWSNLDEMLAKMDIVSVNCPSTPATFHLLSKSRLSLLKQEAYIVNTARGDIIDENALAALIETGQLAGAGLDVFEKEPALNPRLLQLAEAGKIVLLPHMGSATIESRIEMGERVIINIRAFFDHHRPPDRIIPTKNST